MADKYTITFHFTGTTITASYSAEEDRDDVFKSICNIFNSDDSFFKFFKVDGDTIINLKQVLCITKGKQQEWKSVAEH